MDNKSCCIDNKDKLHGKDSECCHENHEHSDVHAKKECHRKEMEQEIQKLRDEIADLKNSLMRNMADAENLRKRLEREKTDAVRFANTSFAKSLLPTLDNFEHVMDHLSGQNENNMKAILDGIALCKKELLNAFEKQGIKQIETKPGDDFNHEYHQAMCEVDSKDQLPGQIVSVMQSGYVYNDRLLRPVMVSVAKKS